MGIPAFERLGVGQMTKRQIRDHHMYEDMWGWTAAIVFAVLAIVALLYFFEPHTGRVIEKGSIQHIAPQTVTVSAVSPRRPALKGQQDHVWRAHHRLGV